jgi:hypothetical protein
MLWHMRTTVRLDETLMKRAKGEAARRGETLTSLIEEGLRLVLAQSTKRAERAEVQLPVCPMEGGTLPGVDIANSSDLLDRLEGIK